MTGIHISLQRSQTQHSLLEAISIGVSRSRMPQAFDKPGQALAAPIPGISNRSFYMLNEQRRRTFMVFLRDNDSLGAGGF
jgi:hypothetical protein